jgi:hypothetical protein
LSLADHCQNVTGVRTPHFGHLIAPLLTSAPHSRQRARTILSLPD